MTEGLNNIDSDIIEHGLNVLSPRWTTAVLIELSKGKRRTTHLLRALPGLSAKTLTERLRKLQELGIISRQTFNEVPPRVEYTLTERGNAVLKLLVAVKQMREIWKPDTANGGDGGDEGGDRFVLPNKTMGYLTN